MNKPKGEAKGVKTISQIKENDYRKNLKRIIVEQYNFPLPSTSEIYQLGLHVLHEMAKSSTPPSTYTSAYTKFESDK